MIDNENALEAGHPPEGEVTAELVAIKAPAAVLPLSKGHGLLLLTLSVSQVVSWIGLGKTKVNELCSNGELATAKVDGRTLILTSSVIALIERNRVVRDR